MRAPHGSSRPQQGPARTSRGRSWQLQPPHALPSTAAGQHRRARRRLRRLHRSRARPRRSYRLPDLRHALPTRPHTPRGRAPDPCGAHAGRGHHRLCHAAASQGPCRDRSAPQPVRPPKGGGGRIHACTGPVTAQPGAGPACVGSVQPGRSCKAIGAVLGRFGRRRVQWLGSVWQWEERRAGLPRRTAGVIAAATAAGSRGCSYRRLRLRRSRSKRSRSSSRSL